MTDTQAGVIAAVIDLIEAYAEINMEICGDNILMDPLLRGHGFNQSNEAISQQCSIRSTIHSAKYHACKELVEQIKAMHLPAYLKGAGE